MIDDDIRLLLLTRRRAVKDLLLSEHLLFVFSLVAQGYNTTTKLQFYFEKSDAFRAPSIQATSSKLKSLYTKGYLSRAEKAQDSGGIEFVYSVRLVEPA